MGGIAAQLSANTLTIGRYSLARAPDPMPRVLCARQDLDDLGSGSIRKRRMASSLRRSRTKPASTTIVWPGICDEYRHQICKRL